MAIEIERKFLVKRENWVPPENGVMFQQGYIFLSKQKNVRIRIAGASAKITIKAQLEGIARREFEYEIPVLDAQMMLNEMHEGIVISKKRFKIAAEGNLIWEVDEFFKENHGLLLAEIELDTEDQHFELPDWIGEEVTGDVRYFNAYLAKKPYTTW